MRSRRIVATAAAFMVVMGAAATPAAAAGPGPQPVTNWVDAVPVGERTWVQIYWTTGRKICDGKVTVTGEDVRIGYPENTETYTSFSQRAKLKPGRLDYTAFTVHPKDGPDLRPLEATLTYHTCGKQAAEKSEKFRLNLAVLDSY